MNGVRILFANAIFFLSTIPNALRFLYACAFPRSSQRRLLNNMLHALGRDDAWFAAQRATSYEDYRAEISRIAEGAQEGLTGETVRYLAPTSGSTGGNKLIPFTDGLKKGFRYGIDPWICFLYIRFPALFFSTHYWVVTPAVKYRGSENSQVPIGFEDDRAYVGGIQGWVLDTLLTPAGYAKDAAMMDEWRYLTALALVADRELGIISCWSPSLFQLVLDEVMRSLPCITDDLAMIYSGVRPSHVPEALYARMRVLRRREDIDRLSHVGDPAALYGQIWPKLKVLSAWADASATEDANVLAQTLPTAVLQPKGLLATECFVTLPLGTTTCLLAYGSHYFEFIEDGGAGDMLGVDELKTGKTYSMLVTTQSGFVRYATGDRVLVTKKILGRPSLCFVGRTGTSDLRGEKLDEGFVEEGVRQVFHEAGAGPTFWIVAPRVDASGVQYVLFLPKACADPKLAAMLEKYLRRSFHYDYCRRVGQLDGVALFGILDQDPMQVFIKKMSELSQCRLGDVKPTKLSRLDCWPQVFSGEFIG